MGTVSHGNSLWLRLTLAKLIAICAAIWSSVRFIHMRTFEAEVSNITASAKVCCGQIVTDISTRYGYLLAALRCLRSFSYLFSVIKQRLFAVLLSSDG
jgi:hypothetical protein